MRFVSQFASHLVFKMSTIRQHASFNQLSDDIICERIRLLSLVKQPTRGQHILDRVYVLSPTYNVVRVVTSVVKSDHKPVVA